MATILIPALAVTRAAGSVISRVIHQVAQLDRRAGRDRVDGDGLRLDPQVDVGCKARSKNLATTSPTMAFKSRLSLAARFAAGSAACQGEQLIRRVRQLSVFLLQSQQTLLDRLGAGSRPIDN